METIPRAFRLGVRATLALLAGLALLAPALALAQPLNGTFIGRQLGRQVEFSYNGKPHNDWAGVLKFRLDDGTDLPVFCIQLDVRVSAGDRYRSNGSVVDLPNGCQIRYLLDAYPASTAADADEAAARQLAIWAFSDNLDLSTVADAKVRDRAIALATEAKGKPCPARRTEAPDLALEPQSASGTAGQVLAYTVRSSPTDAGQTITIVVDGPAALSDASGVTSGQQQQQLALDAQGAATFWVVASGPGQSSVSVTLPYELGAGTVYSELDPNQPSQRLVLAESAQLSASAAAQVQWAARAPDASPTPTAPPTPTRRRQPPAPTETPPEITPTGEAPSPTPPAAVETVVATPGASDSASTPTAQAEQPTPAGPAGGAAPTRPRSLPRTGDNAGAPLGLLLLGVALLMTGGWLVRRRARR